MTRSKVEEEWKFFPNFLLKKKNKFKIKLENFKQQQKIALKIKHIKIFLRKRWYGNQTSYFNDMFKKFF